MNHWTVLALTFFLVASLVSACAPAAAQQEPVQINLADLGPAPELVGDVWLNAAAPLRLAGLLDKVVLVEMWTFG